MCNCNNILSACSCESACPITLDFRCILYNKFNQEATALDGLNLSNGATLKTVIELLDDKIKELNMINTSLVFLRTKYTINTFTQFATSVNLELSSLNSRLAAANIA